MEYDHRDVLPDEYRNREERPIAPRKIDGNAIGEERNHQWRDLQTDPPSTARR